jgi:hypothetical protein
VAHRRPERHWNGDPRNPPSRQSPRHDAARQQGGRHSSLENGSGSVRGTGGTPSCGKSRCHCSNSITMLTIAICAGMNRQLSSELHDAVKRMVMAGSFTAETICPSLAC